MTVTDLHERVVKPVREQTTLAQCAVASGSVIAVDCSPFAIKAFYPDAPSFFRADEETTTQHRSYFARLINGLISCGFQVLMVLDGGRLPLKAAEHARRGRPDQRADIKKAAEDADMENDRAGGDYQWRKLVYPAPDLVYDFVLGFCRRTDGAEAIVAPFEADSQAAFLVQQGYADYVLTTDGDLVVYGAPQVVFAEGQKKYWLVRMLESVLDRTIGTTDLTGYSLLDFQTVAAAAGCDYVQRVHGFGWPKLLALFARCKAAPLLGRRTSDDFGTYGVWRGTIITVEPNRVEICWDDDTGGWYSAAEAVVKLLPEGDDATTRLQVRFAQSMAVENRQSGSNARPDYERSLLAAYAAFASPLAWEPTSPVQPRGTTGRQWPAHAELQSVRLVGAVQLLDAASAPPPASPGPPASPSTPALDLQQASRLQHASSLAAAQPILRADATTSLALCVGDLHPRSMQPRQLPTDIGDDPETEAIPPIHVEDLDGTRLERFAKGQLEAWLTSKLNYPLSAEMRKSKTEVLEHVRCVLEIMKAAGSEQLDFAQRKARCHALAPWLEEDVTLSEMQPCRTNGEIISLAKELPPMEKLFDQYMPLSFKSSYERAYGNLEGHGLRTSSVRASRFTWTQCNDSGVEMQRRPAANFTFEIGASQKAAVVYTTTVGFVLPTDTSPGFVLHSPASECSCPSRICCAHGLVLMAALLVMQGERDYAAFCKACPTYSEEQAAGAKFVELDYVHRYSQRRRRATQHRETVAAEGAGEKATAQLHCRHRSRVCVPQTREEAEAIIKARVQDIVRAQGDRLGPGEDFVSLQQRPVWRPDIKSGDREHIALLRKFYKFYD